MIDIKTVCLLRHKPELRPMFTAVGLESEGTRRWNVNLYEETTRKIFGNAGRREAKGWCYIWHRVEFV